MMSDYSLVGFESINVLEYLPILEKIKMDLELVLESCDLPKIMLKTMQFETTPKDESFLASDTKNELENSLVHRNTLVTESQPANNSTQTDITSGSSSQCYTCRSLHEETNNPNTLIRQKIDEIVPRVQNLEMHEHNDDDTIDNSEFKDNVKKSPKEYEKMLKLRDQKILELESKINDQVENAKSLTNDSDETIKKLESHIETFKKNIIDKDNCIYELQTKISDMESENYKFDDNYQTTVNNLKQKRNELRDKECEIIKLESELDDERKNCKTYERNFRKLSKELDSCNEEKCELENKFEELEKMFKIQKKKLKECEKDDIDEKMSAKYLKELEDLKKTCSANAKEIDKLTIKSKELTDAKESIQKKLNESLTKTTSKDKEISEMKSKLDNEVKKSSALEEDLKKKQQAIATMKTKLQNMQVKDPNETNEYKILKRDLDMKNEEMEQLEYKVKNYRQNLEEKFKECDMLNIEISKNKEELENFKRLNFNCNFGGEGQPNQPQQQPVDLIQGSPRVAGPTKYPYPEWWRKHMYS